MATWQEVPSTSSPLLANTSRSMEKATGMETKITGALRTLGAIYTANSISESRKLFSHRRMGTCGSFAWTPNSGAWQDTYAMPCHAIHPFHETWQFSQSVRAHPAKLRHRVATRIPTESPIVRASIKLRITTVPSPVGWQLGGYFSAPRNGRTATVSA